MGKNKIGQFISSAMEKLNVNKRGKITNHSVRKTSISTLLDRGVPHNTVAQLSGHKSLKSLDSYSVASQDQQREMSKILSGQKTSTFGSPPNHKQSTLQVSEESESCSGRKEISRGSIFSGANIGVINIQSLVIPGLSSGSATPLHSSDEEN